MSHSLLLELLRTHVKECGMMTTKNQTRRNQEFHQRLHHLNTSEN